MEKKRISVLVAFLMMLTTAAIICGSMATEAIAQQQGKLKFVGRKAAANEISFYRRSPRSLRDALENAPIDQLVITDYDQGRHSSRSWHYFGLAVDIGIRGLSRSQIKSLLQYFSSFLKTEYLFCNKMPHYNIMAGRRCGSSWKIGGHRTHIHLGMIP